VRAADARRRLEEVEAPVLLALDELRVSHPAHHPQRVQHGATEIVQRARLGRCSFDRVGAEEPSAVIYLERWIQIPVRLDEQRLPCPHDRIDMEHRSSYEPLEQMKRLAVPQFAQQPPHLLGIVQALDADG
jgi:hypothetical protein